MSVEAAAEELGVSIEEVPDGDRSLPDAGFRRPASAERLNSIWLVLTGSGRPPVRVRSDHIIAFYKAPHRAEIVVELTSGTAIRLPLGKSDSGDEILEFLERETHQ